MVVDKFPIAIVDELFEEWHGIVYFSKLNMYFGYYQIDMLEKDINKMAFSDIILIVRHIIYVLVIDEPDIFSLPLKIHLGIS